MQFLRFVEEYMYHLSQPGKYGKSWIKCVIWENTVKGCHQGWYSISTLAKISGFDGIPEMPKLIPFKNNAV